jgi:pyruvate dehydrogenase E2 component (dihydrolipoamide acetyltransferase)
MQFHLPDVGEGITESVLIKWHVRPGQAVTEDDALCQIETDKALVEIPVPWTGTVVALHVEEGKTVSVGTVIVDMDVNGDCGQQAAVNSGARAAPHTRRVASELKVDLAGLQGTGPRGRILEKDVRAAASLMQNAPEDSSVLRTPMSRLRRVIAKNMRRSVTLIPHATSSFRCDAAALVELRGSLRSTLGHDVSYTAMVIKCLAPAIREYPYFNASIDEETSDIVSYRHVHIGFATHTDEGLIVPVVRDPDRKSLAEVNDEVERLAAAARNRSIAVGDLRGATLTFSNIGSHGGHEVGGRPIINHPQVAVIAMGRIRPEPVVHEGQVCARPTVMFTTSYDHRLIDGAYASLFMERLIALIEQPAALLACTQGVS